MHNHNEKVTFRFHKDATYGIYPVGEKKRAGGKREQSLKKNDNK